jgi:hypothetical protein
LSQENTSVDGVLPAPLHYEWDQGVPCVARIYPPNRHPAWTSKVAGPYLEEAKSFGVTRFFMPDFSCLDRRILKPENLTEKKRVRGLEIVCNPGYVGGALLDVKRGEAVAVATGGCINLIFTVRMRSKKDNFCVYLHGHRGLLIDQIDVAKSGKPSGQRLPSIIERVLASLKQLYDVAPSQVSMYGVGGVHPRNYPHDPKDDRQPLYKETNENLPTYLNNLFPNANIDEILPRFGDMACLNTSALAVEDAYRCGIKTAVVPETLPPDGENGFVSTGLHDKRRDKRNLFLFWCAA